MREIFDQRTDFKATRRFDPNLVVKDSTAALGKASLIEKLLCVTQIIEDFHG